MKFKFELVRRPGTFYKATDAISRLPQTETEKTQGATDDIEDIPAPCIVAQVSKDSTVTEKYEDGEGLLPSTEKLMEAEANGAKKPKKI